RRSREREGPPRARISPGARSAEESKRCAKGRPERESAPERAARRSPRGAVDVGIGPPMPLLPVSPASRGTADDRDANVSETYNRGAIALHWITAALIIANLLLGLSMVGLPISPRKLSWYLVHKSIGIT